MDKLNDSTDRAPVDYVLFALACVAFMFAVCAVVVAAPILAFLSGLVLVVAILTFRFRSWVNE